MTPLHLTEDQHALQTAVLQTLSDNMTGQSRDDCKRLFHGRGGCWVGAESVTVEKYGCCIALILYHADNNPFWEDLIADFCREQGYQFAVQRRWMAGSPWEFPHSEATETLFATEQGLSYQLRFDRQNPGLFLDMAAGRQWVRRQSAGWRVANLFSYTCGFSLAAAAGGATATVNFDMSRAALKLGKDNMVRNDLAGQHQYYPHDINKSLGKISKLGPFDLVIIDPPTQQRHFDPVGDYRRLLRRSVDWVVPGGWLMLTQNDPQTRATAVIDDFSTLLAAHFSFDSRLQNPDEICERDPELGLKVLLFRRNHQPQPV